MSLRFLNSLLDVGYLRDADKLADWENYIKNKPHYKAPPLEHHAIDTESPVSERFTKVCSYMELP